MRLTSFTAATVAVMAGSALLVAAPGASSADPTRSSAYGVSVNAGGQQAVPPSPTVESTDGSAQPRGDAIPPEAGPLLAGGVLELTAGDDKASVEVTDLTIGNVAAELPPELTSSSSSSRQACEQLREAPAEELAGHLRASCRSPWSSPPTAAVSSSSATAPRRRVRQPRHPRHAAGRVQRRHRDRHGARSQCPRVARTARRPGERRAEHRAVPGQPAPQRDAEPSDRGAEGRFTVDGLVVSLGGGQAEAVVASTTCGEGIPQAAGGSSRGADCPGSHTAAGQRPGDRLI